MSNMSLVKVQSSEQYLTTLKWQAETLIRGGVIPSHWKSAAQVCSAIMLADELGIGRVVALRGMYGVHGKTSMNSQLMLALSLPSLAMWQVSGDENSCTVRSRRRDMSEDSIIETTFTMDDAKKMGLAGGDNYRKQPKTMLEWRAIARNLRVACADVLNGIGYTHEELNRPYVVTEDGNIELDSSKIVEEAEPVSPEPSPQPANQAKEHPKEQPAEPTEEMKVNPREVVKSAEPGMTPEADRLAREYGNQKAKERVESEKKAQEIWFAPEDWERWVSVALVTLDLDVPSTLQKLSMPKHRNAATWSKQMVGMAAALDEKKISYPPLPSGVLTEDLANG